MAAGEPESERYGPPLREGRPIHPVGGNCPSASAARAGHVGELEKGHLAAMARSHPILPMIPMSGQVELPAWCLVAGMAAVCLAVVLAVRLRRIRRRLTVTLESLVDPNILARPLRDGRGRVVDFRFIDANPAACAWIGKGRGDIVRTRLLDEFPALGSTELLARFVATAETGRLTALDDVPFPLGADRIRWVDIRAARVDRYLTVTWRDVTDRHEVAATLAASEELFRLLAENSSAVVVRIGKDDEVRWVSPSVTAVLGWSPDEWIGRTIASFGATAADHERLLNEQHKTRAGRAVVLRAQLLTKTGPPHWVEIHAAPSRTAAGAIDGVVASLSSIEAEMATSRILEQRAQTDELTSLFNRDEALERVTMLNARSGRRSAMLWCDIDRFKLVNDTHGHAAGDAVLRALADRIRACLRSTDDLGARLGGDELMVVLHGVRDLDDACRVAEKLRRLAAEPIQTPAGTVETTLSIGVTLALPGESTDAIIARADDAMYQAKHDGRNRVVAITEDGVIQRQAAPSQTEPGLDQPLCGGTTRTSPTP
jgi:diguanylate cyclase (GGDEF)-like protein/PAS domain S-box-containing protein